MTNRVQDGFDNVESGGAPPAWPDQDTIWTCSPRPHKVKIHFHVENFTFFCRMLKNKDRWLKKFIGNSNRKSIESIFSPFPQLFWAVIRQFMLWLK